MNMRLPAEWETQSGVMLTWPDGTTPWYELEKVQECYGRIISAILRFEKVLLVTADVEAAAVRLAELGVDASKIRFQECPINDTWARDHGGIAVYGDNGEKYLYDFVFNGWGLKFASNFDNGITKKIFFDRAFTDEVACVDMRPFVLEGGSIDTDGAGTLMATSECLCSDNRNEYLTKEEIEDEIKHAFGLKRVLWVDSGHLSGDDTDSHIDILARFCDPETIAYLKSYDPEDPDHESLMNMEAQLQSFRTLDGNPYRLVPLPKPKQMFLDDYPLPASYANFLIINGAVLVPGTGSKLDEVVRTKLKGVFPDREIILIDCRPLLSGHGGLHCVTMQLPEGWLE